MVGFHLGKLIVVPGIKILELPGLSSVKGIADGQGLEIPVTELVPFSDDDYVTPIASEEELC